MLTTQEIFEEYTQCLLNPAYAIETYLETFDKTQEGFVPFKLFPRQLEIIKAYNKYRFNIVTKPRQAGVSTTTAAYMAVKVGWADPDNPENILIIANKQELAFEFLAKIKDFLSQLPRWVWGEEYYGSPEKEKKAIFDTNSKKEIRLPNKSRVKAVATSKDALRGFTPTYLIMDEAAYIDNGAEVFGAALTALGTGGKAMLISTPNGMDELYYKTYDQAKNKKNNFNIVEMKWYEDLRYNIDLRWYRGDEVHIDHEKTFEKNARMLAEGWKPSSTWYEQMCLGMNNDAKMIAQELDVSFIGSGGNVIGEEYIAFQEKNYAMPPKATFGLENEIWVWEEPQEGHQYIAGVDVARGDGADASTIVILDFTTMEQVMEYQGKIQPDLLAQIVEEWCNKYKAYTVVDITGGMGVATVLKLLEFEFKHLHYENVGNKVLSGRQLELANKEKADKIPGFHANGVRLAMVAHMETQIRLNQVKVRSTRLISEMKTFIFSSKEGRPDHMKGYHDDLLMSLGMALWVVQFSFKNLEKLEKQNKAMLNSWMASGSNQGATVTGLDINTGKEVKKVVPPNHYKNHADPNGQYLWLFSGMNKR